MKKWISLFMILAILCSLAACTAPALQDGSEAPADSKESPEADLTVCPHYVEQKYLDMATSLPAIIFSTTGEENGLVNNIYLFRGQVLDATTLADIPTITVATEYGNVSIYNLYYYIYQNCVEEMGHETADFIFEHGNDYIFPEVGATAIFTAVYQGYAEVLDMPSFILGVNDFLLGITDDTSSETQPSEAQPPETLPPDTQPTEAQSPATQPPATQPPATQPPATQPSATQPPETEPPVTAPVETATQRSAVSKAKSYLRVKAFSHDGLVSQLEYEGYSHEDAVYGADHCGADWNEQAVKAATSYLNTKAFSCAGLIKQLEYEKFSSAQATYGATNCGADWNEQAVKAAKSYLNIKAFSCAGLIKQLEYEKFSSAQATYGATNCGADWYEQAVKAAKSYLSLMSFSRDRLISQLEFDGFTHDQAVYGTEKNGL